MDIQLLEFSIVVVASDCNPTILNPDFLARQDIVPDDWGWNVAGPPITTPPFATVSYDSGVSVSVQPDKFQVVCRPFGKQIGYTHRVPSIARSYVKVLPHVRYLSVGHNFRNLKECADAESFLKERFLKLGRWESDKHNLQALSLKFVYPLNEGQLNLSLDGAKVIDRSADEAKEVSGILAYANYHRNCQGYPSFEQVIRYTEHIEEDQADFSAILSEILE